MHASVFELEIKNIIEEINKRTNHNYLNTQIRKPEPSYQKIGLLFLYLTTKSYELAEIRAICIAVGIIQMGLDIHEWVTNEHIELFEEIEIRQLQVLAGDYFSSQYYQLLSSVGDIASIQVIARSVQKMNEHKVVYYEQKNQLQSDFDQWIAYKCDIDVGIFYGHIAPQDHNWEKLIHHFIQLDLLHSMDTNSQWDQRLVQLKYVELFNQTKNLINDFPDQDVSNGLHSLLQYYENNATSNLVAEEI